MTCAHAEQVIGLLRHIVALLENIEARMPDMPEDRAPDCGYDQLLAIHEMVEAALSKKDGK